MSFITLDFETFYADKYSLTSLTYEDYILGPRFKVHSVQIKIDTAPTYYVRDADVKQHLQAIFTPGNEHHMLCHNTLFDAAILSWYYRLTPAFYYDTQAMFHALRDWESASLDNMAHTLLNRRKGDGLVQTKGVEQLDDAQHRILSDYGILDVELTFDCFKEMLPYFPASELYQIHWATRTFAEPKFVLDRELTQETLVLSETHQKDVIAASGVVSSILGNSAQFADYIKEVHGIDYPQVKSPTAKNKGNMRYPFAKDDLKFLKLRGTYPELEHLWLGKLAKGSNQEKTRAQRFLNHEQWNGTIAVALKYWGAHTGRYSGTNKINMQNLGRNSKLRNCLCAPNGYKVIAPDFSNIEGRVSAWFAGDTLKCSGYDSGVDYYNKLATDVFGYPVDRKAVNDLGKKLFAMEGAIGKTGELGLGYGMGAAKFWETCAKGPMGEAPIHLEDGLAKKTVMAWRRQNSAIVQMWQKLDVVLEQMTDPNLVPYKFGPLEIHYQRVRLPNGMFLNYPKLAWRQSVFDNEDGSARNGYSYWNGKWHQDTWGGTFLENIIQALARIIMSDSLERTDKHFVEHELGWMVLTVHDENVAIVREDQAQECLDFVIADMRLRPQWAPGLPLDAEGKISNFFAKG